jgi:hypothetical protein
MEATRRERRAGSRRARARSTKEKVDKFIKLYRHGASERVIASSLGYSLEDARELLAIAKAPDSEAGLGQGEGGG